MLQYNKLWHIPNTKVKTPTIQSIYWSDWMEHTHESLAAMVAASEVKDTATACEHPLKNQDLPSFSNEDKRQMTMNVEKEVAKLQEEIKRLGQVQPDGSYKVKFGVLFNDDRCANIFEALVGTLRAAKKRKMVAYDGELLLQGVHDSVEIILKSPLVASASTV